MNTAEEGAAALAAVCADWNRAGERWDADALAAVYTTDAAFFGGRPGHALGRAAICDYFRSYEGMIESAALAFVDPHVAALAPEVYLVQGYADFSFTLADGAATRSVLRATLVVAREEGRWRIRQHHFSPSPEAPPLGH